MCRVFMLSIPYILRGNSDLLKIPYVLGVSLSMSPEFIIQFTSFEFISL